MVIYPDDICGVIVTRGDVDLAPVTEQIPFTTVVWDNSEDDDLSVYGRYAMIEHLASSFTVIYVQDDDCIVPPESIAKLCAAYQPGHVVCNMPERFREHYPDSALVGFGAVFDRDLPAQAFFKFGLNGTEMFFRTCDVVFTTLTPRILVDVPVEILPCAHDAHRMWKQHGHFGERERMLTLARQVRDAVPA